MTSRLGLSKFRLLLVLGVFGFAVSCSSSSDIEQVQTDAGHLRQEINSLQASQESLRIDNNFYKAELDKLDDANKQLFLMLSDQAKKINDQSVLVTIQANKIAAQASEIDTQMDAIVSQSSEITVQTEQINIQAQQILDLQSSLEEQGIQIIAQQQKSKNIEGKVSTQSQVAGQLKSDLDAQKAADDDLLEKINKLPAAVCSIEDSSADVRSNTFKVTISGGYGASSGTAFFIGNSEFITNEHVVDNNGPILLSNDQQKFYATIVAISPSRDLALLKVANSITLVPTGLTTVAITDSDTGKQIGVTGYPKGLGETPSVSYGVISRVFLDDNKNEKLQTDAAISPGSSGGPVFNQCGKVVGVISSKLTGTSIEGIGFAFSSDTLTNFLSDVSARGLR